MSEFDQSCRAIPSEPLVHRFGVVGHRNGVNAAGELWPQMQVTVSNGSARAFNYTCPGVYYALHQHADGHRDPATARCTSLSTQYRLHAIPAFVVEAQTRSTNADLEVQKKAQTGADEYDE